MSSQPLCASSPLISGRTCSLLLGKEEIRPGEHDSIPRRSYSESSPLTAAQERIWLLNHLQPSGCLTRQFGLRLQGKLNLPAIHRALETLLHRHEILRTTFDGGVEGTRQIVGANCEINLPIIDLSEWPEDQREGVASRLVHYESSLPFDLRAGPLLRTKLLRLSDSEHHFVVTVHRIVMDEASEALFLGELLHLYEGDVPPEPPIQYADLAEWQAKRIRARLFNRELRYWKQRLASAPVLLEIPADRLRPAVKNHCAARVPMHLGVELTEKLRAVGKREECTLFMTLLAAFQTLVHRYTGSDDVMVGAPLTDRSRPEVEGLIGCLTNTVALRTGMSGDPTFRELLSRVRKTTLGALAHQELPFEKIRENPECAHDPGSPAFFRLLFDFDSTSSPPQHIKGLEISPLTLEGGNTEFDLTLHLRDNGHELDGWVEYATELFDRCTIERLIGHFETLLAGIAKSSFVHLSGLPLLTEEERAWQLIHFDNTVIPQPHSLPVHEWIRSQVELQPDTVAVQCGEQSLTYGELDLQSDRLARVLSTLEVGAGDVVAVCLDRSVEMAVALVGILKAGAAHLPLDPENSEAALVRILRESRPHALLTIEGSTRNLSFCNREAGEFGVGLELPIIYLDAEVWDGMSCETACRPWSYTHPDDLACVIYPPDAGADPAGVRIPHRALSNLVSALRERLGVCECDTLLAVNGASSGNAVFELLLPLIAGARVVIASDDTLSSWLGVRQLCEEVQPTLMQASPEMWRSLLQVGWQGHQALQILCGGEAWSEELAHQLLSHCGVLWHVYGTPETGIWSTASRVRPAEPLRLREPLGNTSLHILDPQQQPVPIGVPGELYIGGDGVALGYLHQPELTAETFIPNPFRENSRGRLYRTGDRVRYRPEGGIEFLGRMEPQVKILGCHLELGSIEEILRSHPSVAQAVVTVSEECAPLPRFVAYIVPSAGCSTTTMELEQFLRNALPEYMVPSAIVMKGVLPTSSRSWRQGVDINALYSPQAQERADSQDAAQDSLGKICREVLGPRNVGAPSGFFSLGGNSFLVICRNEVPRNALRDELSSLNVFRNTTDGGVNGLLEGTIGSREAAMAANELGNTEKQLMDYRTIQETIA